LQQEMAAIFGLVLKRCLPRLDKLAVVRQDSEVIRRDEGKLRGSIQGLNESDMNARNNPNIICVNFGL